MAKSLKNQTKWMKESFYLQFKRKGKRISFCTNDILNCLADIIICNTMVCFISYFIRSFLEIAKEHDFTHPKILGNLRTKLIKLVIWRSSSATFLSVLNTKMSGRWRMNTNVISAKDPFYFFCYGYRDKPTEFQAKPLIYFYSASF